MKLAARIGDFESAILYRTQADNLLCFLQVVEISSIFDGDELTIYLVLLESVRRLHNGQHGRRHPRQVWEGLKHSPCIYPHMGYRSRMRCENFPAVLGQGTVQSQRLRRLVSLNLPYQQGH